MKYYIKDEDGRMYDVETENDYIVSYSSINTQEFDRAPDLKDAYFQIKESLPSRFDAWIIK